MTPSQRSARSIDFGAPERADAPDRHPWSLHGVADRRELGRLHGVVLAVVLERLAGPEPAHDVEALVHQLGPDPSVALLAERVEAGVDGAEPDAERDPTGRDAIDGGDLARELPRPTTRRRGEHRAEADLRDVRTAARPSEIHASTPHTGSHTNRPSQPASSAAASARSPMSVGIAPGDHEAVLHVPTVASNRCSRPCSDGRARI